MRTKGFTLVEVMIVVGIIAALSVLIFPNILRARLNANEANAQAALRTIATACESFAGANVGDYPTAITDLTGATPPHLNSNPLGTNQGYVFACGTMTATGYSCTAQASSCNNTGNNDYTITTGGVLTSAVCTP